MNLVKGDKIKLTCKATGESINAIYDYKTDDHYIVWYRDYVKMLKINDWEAREWK